MSLLNRLMIDPRSAAVGTMPAARGGTGCETIVSTLQSKYGEACANGEIFALVLGATTTGVAAGNIVGAAAAAATQFAIWNPLGNDKDLELIRAYIGVISGTIVGGPPFHGVFAFSAMPSIANQGAALNCKVNGAAPSARYCSLAAGTALTTAAPGPSVLRPFPGQFSAGTYAALAGSPTFYDEIDGSIILPPGTGWAPLWAGAGTSVLNAYGVVWRERPRLS